MSGSLVVGLAALVVTLAAAADDAMPRSLGAPVAGDAPLTVGEDAQAAPAPALTAGRGDPERQVLRIAVYALELSGVEPRLGRLVDRFLLAELRKLAHVNVVGMEEIQQMLDHEAAKQLMGCSADESCLADIAGALGVDEIVTGTLARVGDEHVIGLRRIDQRNAAVRGSVSMRLVAEKGEEFLAAVGPAVKELYPERELRAGTSRGVDPEVALALDPPPLDPWLTGSVAAGAAALSVGALGAGALHALSSLLYFGLLDDAATSPQPWSSIAGVRNAANAFAVTGYVLVAGTVIAGSTAGVMALFTDWKGYRDAMAEPPAE